MSSRGGDIPATVAAVMWNAPSLVLRTGIAYLRLKRRIRRGTRYVIKGMVENGLPRELAIQLAQTYETDLSVRRLIGGLRHGPSRGSG